MATRDPLTLVALLELLESVSAGVVSSSRNRGFGRSPTSATTKRFHHQIGQAVDRIARVSFPHLWARLRQPRQAKPPVKISERPEETAARPR